MHTCPPPKKALEKWLIQYPSVKGPYGHLLLEQKGKNGQALLDALRPYFESAHLDAREHFHAEAGIDLHPDATGEAAGVQYPGFLPDKAKGGLFGEVMAGLIAESYEMVGEHIWSVPIFLFRYHEDAGAYLFDLVRDPKKKREIFGRKGDDFIGVSFDDDGAVVRFIAGEAKWRKNLIPSVVTEMLNGKEKKTKGDAAKSATVIKKTKGIWQEINTSPSVPQGVRQLQRLLEDNDPETYSAAILSLDKALIASNPAPIPRTDLILIVGNKSATYEKGNPYIGWQEMPTEYTAGNDLQVVEVILQNGDVLIEKLYESLWLEEKADA